MMQTNENQPPDPDSPESIDLLELRALARLVVNDPDRLPVVVRPLVTAERGADGRITGVICEAERGILRIAGVPDREYSREPGESVEEFTQRIERDLPVRYEGRELWADRGGPGIGCFSILLLPREDSHDSQAPPLDCRGSS